MHFRQSDVSAASYQVLDTILSQAHRVTFHKPFLLDMLYVVTAQAQAGLQ